MTIANYEQEKLEVASLLGSGIFSRAPSLAQLLTYICEKYFEGAANQIKEYNIAVEALGRPADFDQKRDSIVRVEAHRLRKRLKEYYETTGADHAVRILIPSGQYAPRFVFSEAATSVVLVDPPAGYAPARPKSARVNTGVLIGAAALVLAGAALLLLLPSRHSAAPTAATASVPPGDKLVGSGETIRILAGAVEPYMDRYGQSWLPDRYFTGGIASSSPNHPIFGTRDPKMYQTRREGSFKYNIPLAPGSHELRLHFAEVTYGETNAAGGGETSRLFNVAANGRSLLDGIDVVADAGPNNAHIRVFKDIQPAADGYLHLQFDPVISVPFLNAIEIAPGVPGRLLPIRIVARDQPYLGKSGQVWGSDRFYRGGQQVLRTNAITGTPDPDLYRSERFGNISYAIPVAPGRYGLVLHFAETWFGFDKPQKGGPQSRLFDILCNGVALERAFDIYKEAGGADRALRKIYHGLEPSPQGKLVVSLIPVRNYACLNAIEVLDESGSQ